MPSLYQYASGPPSMLRPVIVERVDPVYNGPRLNAIDFRSVAVAMLQDPQLREVRLSMAGGSVVPGQHDDADHDVRVLVRPGEYAALTGTSSSAVGAVFRVCFRGFDVPVPVAVVRDHAPLVDSHRAYYVHPGGRRADRPAVLAYLQALHKMLDASEPLGDDVRGVE
jgi:hypothetical protein